MLRWCQEWFPWEKLSLATSIPASIIFLKTVTLLLAGPNVQIIFVFTISYQPPQSIGLKPK